MKTTENISHAIALSKGKGIGDILYKKLIQKLGSAKAVFDAPISVLQKELKLPPKVTQAIAESKKHIPEAEKLYKKHHKRGIRIIPLESPDYPERLKVSHAPPKILYYKGNASLNGSRFVSIVGTRQPSDYGISWVRDFVSHLKAYNATVVSGLAYGIDFHAHEKAIEEKIATFGIIAGGLDHIYPYAHQSLAEKMSTQGGLLTEKELGTKTEKYNFSMRNRIIAGMTDAVIVVEAHAKSGALITAAYANDIDREVFALPGTATSTRSEGCHNLIKRHKAHLITSAEDLAHMMNWDTPSLAPHKEPPLQANPHLSEKEKSIIDALVHAPISLAIEEISAQSKVPPNLATEMLQKLVATHIVKALPGNRYTTPPSTQRWATNTFAKTT